MPLSEREQKLLDQIEQDLRAEDSKLAIALEVARARPGARQLVIPVVAGLLIGTTIVLAGLVTKIIILPILGFLIVVATVAYATTLAADAHAAHGASATSPTSKLLDESVRSTSKRTWGRRFGGTDT